MTITQQQQQQHNLPVPMVVLQQHHLAMIALQ
jgi:hypothetical protein